MEPEAEAVAYRLAGHVAAGPHHLGHPVPDTIRPAKNAPHNELTSAAVEYPIAAAAHRQVEYWSWSCLGR
jgi:hypothetical protein